jgi:NADH-quinone oxidoreductase subunit H
MQILTPIGDWLHRLVSGWFEAWGLPPLFVELGAWVVAGAVLMIFFAVLALVLVYLERKVAAYIQSRIGPERVGPWGVLQTVADALKLLQKEDLVPEGADKLLHTLGPIIFFVFSAMAYLVVPWERDMAMAGWVDEHIGIVFVLAFTSMPVLGGLLGGWGSNNKWSLLGALRAAAQTISYEIPMLLAVTSVVVVTGTLSLDATVEQQTGWGILSWNLWLPWLWLPALLYLMAATAEVNRVPFDIPEAESELVAGFHTEYSGMKFAFFFLAEYANTFLVGVIFALLFLGGWASPFGLGDPIPGVLWLLGKATVVVIFLMWVRWTLPRLRVDQLMSLSWKMLIPAGFVALFVAALAALFV